MPGTGRRRREVQKGFHTNQAGEQTKNLGRQDLPRRERRQPGENKDPWVGSEGYDRNQAALTEERTNEVDYLPTMIYSLQNQLAANPANAPAIQAQIDQLTQRLTRLMPNYGGSASGAEFMQAGLGGLLGMDPYGAGGPPVYPQGDPRAGASPAPGGMSTGGTPGWSGVPGAVTPPPSLLSPPNPGSGTGTQSPRPGQGRRNWTAPFSGWGGGDPQSSQSSPSFNMATDRRMPGSGIGATQTVPGRRIFRNRRA